MRSFHIILNNKCLSIYTFVCYKRISCLWLLYPITSYWCKLSVMLIYCACPSGKIVSYMSFLLRASTLKTNWYSVINKMLYRKITLITKIIFVKCIIICLTSIIVCKKINTVFYDKLTKRLCQQAKEIQLLVPICKYLQQNKIWIITLHVLVLLLSDLLDCVPPV